MKLPKFPSAIDALTESQRVFHTNATNLAEAQLVEARNLAITHLQIAPDAAQFSQVVTAIAQVMATNYRACVARAQVPRN